MIKIVKPGRVVGFVLDVWFTAHGPRGCGRAALAQVPPTTRGACAHSKAAAFGKFWLSAWRRAGIGRALVEAIREHFGSNEMAAETDAEAVGF
jgi:GNAT superfamily N-acetyltransferase